MYEEKAAQAAALFLLKAGGPMPHLKLMKLLYIADRESYRRRGSPITGDDDGFHAARPCPLAKRYDLMIARVPRTPHPVVVLCRSHFTREPARRRHLRTASRRRPFSASSASSSIAT